MDPKVDVKKVQGYLMNDDDGRNNETGHQADGNEQEEEQQCETKHGKMSGIQLEARGGEVFKYTRE